MPVERNVNHYLDYRHKSILRAGTLRGISDIHLGTNNSDDLKGFLEFGLIPLLNFSMASTPPKILLNTTSYLSIELFLEYCPLN